MMEVTVLNKTRGKKMFIIILIILVILFSYYIYELFVTNDIVDIARKVAIGDVNVERGTPYAIFGPAGKDDYSCNIKRCFVLCGLKEGRIWLTWINVAGDDGKLSKSRDWCELLIKKNDDGKWVAVGINWNP